MTREEFLEALSRLLVDLPEQERIRALWKYSEAFTMMEGCQEEDPDSIRDNLRRIARICRARFRLGHAEKSGKLSDLMTVVFYTIRLGTGQALLIGFLFLLLFLMVIAFYTAAVLTAVTGMAMALSVLMDTIYPLALDFTIQPTAALLIGIGTACLGLLVIIGTWCLTCIFRRGAMKSLALSIDAAEPRKEVEQS
ncbi:MAG: hypothetical protein ACOX6S_06100 [Clostridia bacterium]|jgi:uncharacterized membrane protein